MGVGGGVDSGLEGFWEEEGIPRMSGRVLLRFKGESRLNWGISVFGGTLVRGGVLGSWEAGISSMLGICRSSRWCKGEKLS
jgi:hypothetical protein